MTECCGGTCGCQDGAGLVDVSQLTLRELLETDNVALRRSLEQIIEDSKDPNGVLSAFTSFVE